MCGCSGNPTVSTMTVEQLQAAQEERRAASQLAREQYAASMRSAMENAGVAPESISA